MWDCADPPDEELLRCTETGTDRFFRYVPLKGVSGISVALHLGQIQAIILHRTGQGHLLHYGKADEDAVWIYHPLSAEGILEVWWVSNLTTSALVVSLPSHGYMIHQFNSILDKDFAKACMALILHTVGDAF